MLDHRGAEQGGDGVEDAHVHPVGEEQKDVAGVQHQVLDGGEVGGVLPLCFPHRPLVLGTVRGARRFILEHWKIIYKDDIRTQLFTWVTTVCTLYKLQMSIKIVPKGDSKLIRVNG